MNNRDQFINTRVATALAAAAIAGNAVQVGASIPVGNAVAIAFFLEVSAWVAGDIKIQDVQFADDAGFTLNVDTYTSDDILMKNDRSNDDITAIDQTLLGGIGIRKLSIENRALNDQAFFRVNTITANTADLTAGVIAVIGESVSPVVQS
ncbi:MAG: hypothetical protein ACJASR_001428 [Psychroserpens sp.]|jgi:hypothetical protein